MNDTLAVENASISVSSVTTNFQQLNLQKEDVALPLERDGPSVVIPDHLQVQSADCSHLSFGTFGSCVSAPFSGPLASMPVKANLEEAPLEADGSSVGHSDTRYSVLTVLHYYLQYCINTVKNFFFYNYCHIFYLQKFRVLW